MSNGTVAVSSRPATVSTSKLPAALRFPLLVTLSLSLSSLLYSFSSDYTAGDLATVSRSLNKWSEVAELIGWRTVELAIGWLGEYDSEPHAIPLLTRQLHAERTINLPTTLRNTTTHPLTTSPNQATTSPR